MDAQTYWSVGGCGWVPGRADAGLYWSVQRCRWEPVGPAADALATPWAMFQAAQADAAQAEVPDQRQPEMQSAPVEGRP